MPLSRSSSPRSATYVVAASDSVNKANADLVCTGTADDQQITAFLASKRGIPCTVFFRAGYYSLTSEIVVDTSWITLEGESRGNWNKYSGANSATGLNTFPRSTPNSVGQSGGAYFVQKTSGKGVWKIGTTYLNGDSRHKDIVFYRLSHYSQFASGIAIYDPVPTDISQIVDCNFQGFAGAIEVWWDNPLIHGNNVQDTGGTDSSVKAAIKATGYRGQIYGNVVFQVGGNGIWVGSNGACVFGNIVGLPLANGILVTGPAIKITGNYIHGPGGGQAAGNYDAIVLGNYSSDNNFKNYADGCVISGNSIAMTIDDMGTTLQPGGGAGNGIHIGGSGGTGRSNCDYVSVTGNFIDDLGTGTRTGFAIKFDNSSTNGTAVGNTIRGAWNSGAATKISPGTGNQVSLNGGTT